MHPFIASWHNRLALGLVATMASATTLFAAHDPTHSTNSLPSVTPAANHSGDPTDPAKKSKHHAHTIKESAIVFKAVKLIPVVVVPASQGASDSSAAIIQRDLTDCDRIRPVAVSGNGSAGNAMNFAAFKSAAFAVRLTPVADGLNVELYDVTTHAVRQSGHFALPTAMASGSNETQIRDSLARALALKAVDTRTALTRNTFMRDSVYGVLTTKRPKFRGTQDQTAWVNDSMARAAQMSTLTVTATTLMGNAHKDTLASNAALPLLLAHDTYVRDSLTRETRWALHGVADEVHRWITGERGIAQSRITYVQDGSVRVVDFDGANDHAVTHGGDAMSPAWHPNGHSIVFSDMNDAGTQIAEVNLVSGQTRFFHATPRGLNITPVYTRDGKSIIYANNSTGMNADLVMMSVTDSTAPLRRIAASGYDNSAPCFNPDGTRVAFISPRPKTPQVYSVNLDGSGEQLETPFARGVRSYRTGPDWSPDGRTIAYEQQNGDFQVWSIDINTKHIRKLTDVGENEDPTWAPDARHIAITSTRGGSKTLWILDTESGHYRQLTTAPGARLAAWSPVLASGT
jgi:tol-pal system beta propeller repeat protein TolB